MSKHTPGPWKIISDGSDYIKINGELEKGYPIAKCRKENKFIKGDSLANALLIAAAPDLFEALKNLVDVCKCSNGCSKNDMSCATMAAYAAIAKAEGNG